MLIPKFVALLATQLTSTVAPAGPVQVRFDADVAGVALELQTGSSYTEGSGMTVGRRGISTTHYSETAYRYQVVCVAPCTAELPPQNVLLALSIPDHHAIPTARPIALSQGLVLRGHYVDNSAVRLAGWLTIGATVLGGGALMVHGFSQSDGAFVSVGAGTGVVGSLFGWILTRKDDEAEILSGDELAPPHLGGSLRRVKGFLLNGTAKAGVSDLSIGGLGRGAGFTWGAEMRAVRDSGHGLALAVNALHPPRGGFGMEGGLAYAYRTELDLGAGFALTPSFSVGAMVGGTRGGGGYGSIPLVPSDFEVTAAGTVGLELRKSFLLLGAEAGGRLGGGFRSLNDATTPGAALGYTVLVRLGVDL